MKTEHYTILGKVAGVKYLAEIHPQEHIILCSSGFWEVALNNAYTEKRASDIAKRWLWEHHRPVIFTKVPFLEGWLFVEVQTCLGDIRLAKVVGLRDFKKGLVASYEELSAGENAAVDLLIPGFLARFQSADPEKMLTPTS